MIPIPWAMSEDSSWVVVEDHGDWVRWWFRRELPVTLFSGVAVGCVVAGIVAYMVASSTLVRGAPIGLGPAERLALGGFGLAGLVLLVLGILFLRQCLAASRRLGRARTTEVNEETPRAEALAIAIERAALPAFASVGSRRRGLRFQGEALVETLRRAGVDRPRLLVYGRTIDVPTSSRADFAEPEIVHEPGAEWTVGRAALNLFILFLFTPILFGCLGYVVGPLVLAAAVLISTGPFLLRSMGLVSTTAFSLLAAPGRLAVGRPRQREWTVDEAFVLVTPAPQGGRIATICHGGKRDWFRYARRTRGRLERLMQLWLVPGEPAPPIFSEFTAHADQAGSGGGPRGH